MLLQADRSAAPRCFSPIVRSWERCRELGLLRAHPARLELLEPEELERRKDQHIFFVHLAANELNILRRAIAGTSGMALLADPQGTILDGRGDSGFVGKAKRISLRPGATWSEVLEGTNAIGTALVEQQLVQIAGDQHFLEENRFLVCTAIPVMSPTGEIAGILDISGDVRNPPARASMLLQLATARIEHSWVSLHGAHDLLAAFHPHPNWLGTPHEGLLAFRDELLVAANPAALRLLRLIPEDINRVRWDEIFRNRSFYGRGEIYPRSHPGVFYGSVQKTVTTVAMPAVAAPPGGKAESRSTEILIRDEAIWDTESIQMLTRAKRAFEAGIPILLQGETGTGKEVFVRALQRLSSRASEPFVPVNCAAIPEGLQEAEIFGYEEGAFTGARRKGSPGYIRRAEGGVLFLDEIGDMPLALQAQLLRVLQDGEVTPLGARRAVRVDFRLVAATHHDLQAAVAEGSFRADLYYRLRHMVFYLPPLRKRPNLGGILDAMLASLGGAARGVRLTTPARQKLLEHNWPGNLRELSNLLSALLAFAEDGSWIDADSLPQDIMEAVPEVPRKLSGTAHDLLRHTLHSGGKEEILPRSRPQASRSISSGSMAFNGRMQKPPAVFVSPGGKAESRSTEILIRDEAIWDTESIQMLTRAKRAFEAGIPIILQGETGTGKEVFVRALQRLSSRASEPFVPVNCAAIPEGLQEAEIFGYEEGAFTGARRKGNPGYIRRAEGGVLFLDEIGDMPLALQAQLLRVLQDGEVTPLGARRAVRVDFRLVAATHHDLQAAVAEGSFRADLYYRLRHMVFYLPPLRKRPNLGGILDAMLASLGGEARGVRLTTAARQKLLEHSWPGNLRELSNLLSALLAFAEDGSWIDADSLPQDIMESREAEPEPEQPQKLLDVTNELLRQAIQEHGGNMSAAARQLGLHRSTLYRRLAGAQL